MEAPNGRQRLAERAGVQGAVAAATLGQMGADLGGGHGTEISQGLRPAAMAFEKGHIESADMTIGLQRARRQTTFVRQMLEPGEEGFGRA
ncbi:hypothetical protein D3C86_1872680 [compost metagenome]